MPKMKKKVIEVNSVAISKLTTWMLDKWLHFGDPWLEWWRTEGMDAYMKWASERVKKSMDSEP